MCRLRKVDVREVFNNKLANSAVVCVNEENIVVGRYCQVTIGEDGEFDIWICNPKDIAKGVSQRKVNSMVEVLSKHPGVGKITTLSGEAYFNTKDVNVVLDNLKLLGISKRRSVSKENKEAFTKRMPGA